MCPLYILTNFRPANLRKNLIKKWTDEYNIKKHNHDGYTIDEMGEEFNPRKDQNMCYNDKVVSWLDKLFTPQYKLRETSSGNGIKYSLSRPYPPTVSDTLSHYSSDQAEEEQCWRKSTKETLQYYRSEPEHIKIGRANRQRSDSVSTTDETAASIAIEVPPVSLRPSPVFNNRKKHHNECGRISPALSPCRYKPKQSPDQQRLARRHYRSYHKPEEVAEYYSWRYNE